jgi:hypothetical protein
MQRPPASSMVSGLIAAAGAWLARRSVPPLTGVPAPFVVAVDDDEDELAPPQAARTAPITVLDIPTTAPLRMNCRRLIRPVTSSSM